MKIYFFPLFFLIINSCGVKQNKPKQTMNENFPRLIEFQIKITDEDMLVDFEDGFSPYINLAEPEEDLKNLVNPNEIVLDYSEAILLIDYPVNEEIEYAINSKNKKGFTKKELIELACRKIQEIFKNADNSPQGSEERKNLWGAKPLFHYDLLEMVFEKRADGKIIITFGIDS